MRTLSRRNFLKATSAAGVALASWPFASLDGNAMSSPFPGKFQATWNSLSQYNVPDWFRDAKFGVFVVWGPYAVPAHVSEWYPRLMYRRESPVFEWHRRHWGPQSMFGYKDFIPMFRGERWSPEKWVATFRNAGARYLVQIADFHDGFPMYDSNLTEWTSARMGPRRDVVGELARELRNQRVKFGVSSHRAFHWSFYTFKKDFDTSNPLYAGLYGPIHAPTPLVSHKPGELQQTASREFLQDWYARSVELVNKYHPDLFYFDWANGAQEFEPYRKEFAAYYYNSANRWNEGVVITYKFKAYPEHAAVLDFERGLAHSVRPLPWQTDTSVSWKSWGYIDNDSFKSPGEIVRELVDIVSKNGNLLLSVGPKADGTLPEEAEEIFHRIGGWMDINGEAIYGTRPWRVYGEGPATLAGGSFSESKVKGMTFTPQDIRFTRKDDAIYAVFLSWPEREAQIKELGRTSKNAPRRISNVSLLGDGSNLQWHQGSDALIVRTPDKRPCDYAYAFKITTTS